jgi:hypothetical protein
VGPLFRSISRKGIRRRANWQANIRPVGPAPTINTAGVLDKVMACHFVKVK